MNIFWDALWDAFKDTALVLPVLYLAYLLVGYFSHNTSEKMTKVLHHTNKAGPLVGAFLGCVPQCGFSSVMSQLYSKKFVTLGTLFAVFIATSDEAIPIMISKPQFIPKMLLMLAIKVFFAIIIGFLLDLVMNSYNKRQAVKLRSKTTTTTTSAAVKVQTMQVNETALEYHKHGHIHGKEGQNHDDKGHEHHNESGECLETDCPEIEKHECSKLELCNHEHGHRHSHKGCCVNNIFLDALIHTLIIVAYVFVATLAINLIIGYFGMDSIKNLFTDNAYLQILLASLVGLLPNCAASVFVVEMYMAGILHFSALVAGLCAGAGVGLIVLFTANRKHMLQNILIVIMLYVFAVTCGILSNFLPIM